jgi:diketogulonate reductase-like aldo/keto reductase
MQIPQFLYGTAWKEDLTEQCVFDAVKSGFRAIDTANQRQHYYEEGVGLALSKVYSKLGLSRDDLFLQTKFTYARGQDHRKPYDENAPFKTQVQQSFESSLEHLKVDYIDTYVLHGPQTQNGLTESDWKVWGAMEDIYRSGQIRSLGVSNINFEQLVELYEKSKIKPTFVQNRCFAEKYWDKKIRQFCEQRDIKYQGFSLLTANWKFLGGDLQRPLNRNIPHLLFSENGNTELNIHEEIKSILLETGKNIQQVIFRFAMQIGIIPVIGTRSPEHMQLDLNIQDFTLSESQMQTLEKIAFLE